MGQDNKSLFGTEARILVGGSDEDNLRLVEAALLALGHGVILARNGEEALAKAKEAPNLILLANHLSVIDGIELVKRLKADEATSAVPVVMMTAASAQEDRLKALEAGVDDFLTVPLDRIELRVTVSSLLKVVFYAEQLRRYREEVEAEVARRTESLKQSLKDTKALSLDTVYRLAREAEFRDEDPHGHIERISHYSTAIARKLGLDEAFLQNILFAAPLHDVGKIAIPDRVLRKPGKLDDDEWKVVMQHTPFGAQILQDSEADFLKMAEVIAASHHEKWNGTGYPRGLSGADIPVAGRIVALTDVFDVLTWERPYKKPMPLEKAFAVIREGRGTQFDPAVVDAFFAIKEEIIGEFNWWQFIGSDSDSGSL